MLKCQREGWSCLSGSFLRKLNLPWFPAWVLHRLRSPFREQPVHSFCLRMTVVPPSSSHWDPTRPVAAALGAWVSCWPRERWSSYGWISIAQNVRAGRDHGEGEFPHFPEKAADAQALELAERGRTRKPTGLLAPIHSPFRLQTWPPPHLPSLNFSVGGKRGGSGKDTAGPEMASGLKNCFLRLPFYFYYLGLVCKGFIQLITFLSSGNIIIFVLWKALSVALFIYSLYLQIPFTSPHRPPF